LGDEKEPWEEPYRRLLAKGTVVVKIAATPAIFNAVLILISFDQGHVCSLKKIAVSIRSAVHAECPVLDGGLTEVRVEGFAIGMANEAQ